MSKDVANEDIRNTNQHNFPIENNEGGTTFLIDNDLDAAIDYTVKGTHEDDDTFSDAATLVSGASTGADTVTYETLGYTWDIIRFEVTAQSTPSADSLGIKKME
jgi:hypothetical protein